MSLCDSYKKVPIKKCVFSYKEKENDIFKNFIHD